MRSKVESARSQAREILRAQRINSLLQDLFHDTQCLNETTKDLDTATKRLKGYEYDLTKLDTDHPLYEDRKKDLELRIVDTNTDITNVTKRLESCQKVVDATNARIAKVETGETLISIDAIKELTDELLGI